MASYVYDSLRPYQRTGAHFMRRHRNVLNADQPGLGKTIQTLGSIVAAAAMEDRAECSCGGPPHEQSAHTVGSPRWHLVATPSVAIHSVWKPEIVRWLRDKRVEVLTLDGTLAERNAALATFEPKPDTEHVFVVGNIEALRIKPVEDTYSKQLRTTAREIIRYTKTDKERGKVKMAYHPENAAVPSLFTRYWDTVICDESQRALIRSDKVPTQTRAGFVLVRSQRRIALSGTPMRGKPEQLWGTLNWLRPDLYTSYWTWAKRYFAMESDRYSNFIIGGLTSSGKHRMAADLADIMLRRTKAEVAPDLPPKTYAGYHIIEGDDTSPLGVWLPMESKQSKQYDRLIVEGLVGDSMVNGPLAEYTRARQVAGCYCDVVPIDEEHVRLDPVVKGSPKFEWLSEWLSENDGEKVVVVSQFTSVLASYESTLRDEGYKVASITGRVAAGKRAKAVEGFQNGDVQIMLLNVAAGGVALTLDAADYLVFLDETSIPDDQEQAEDRIHRVSRMHNVTIYYLRTLDTIEEEVAYIAAARQDVQQYLLDGARGVEYARQVYLTSRLDAATNTHTKESETA